MSSQPPHRIIRRIESPCSSVKQGPIKAVKAFSLKQISAPTAFEISPKDGHKLWARYSPDNNRFSPEGTTLQTRSPNIFYKDKTTGSRQSPLPGKLRPSSAGAVVPSYLTGQWPKDIKNCSQSQSDGVYMCDKSAQTVELEIKNVRMKKKNHRRSASLGQGDQFQLQYIKQYLQKSKDVSKFPDCRQHSSPNTVHHLALSLMPPPATYLQHNKAALHAAMHTTRHNVNKFQRNSVEGLNMEIEKLVSSITLSSLSALDDDGEVFRYKIPDGHRAPGPDVIHESSTQSVNTQTTSYQDYTVSPASRSAPISPAITPKPGSLDMHLTPRSKSSDCKFTKGDADSPENTFFSSLNLKKSCPFVREPPDGCDKVIAVEESRQPKIKEPLYFSPVKPNQFVFKPSQGSAFCVPYKNL